MGKLRGKRPQSEGGVGSEAKRRKHGEGDYPPPPVLISAAFESYYRECGVVDESEWDSFISTLREPLGVSFRITGHPDDPASISLRDYMERQHISMLQGLELPDGQPVPPPYPISWYGNRMAWRFDVSRSLLRGKGAVKGDDSLAARKIAAFHHFLMAETELGTISRQEEVSMVPPCLLDVEPGHTVADLCAAPGSKTQQLIEAILPPTCRSVFEHVGPAGLVIANDMEYKRCHLLVHQAKRLHSPALIVTHHDGTMLPTKMSHSLRAVPPGAAAASAEDAPAAETAPPAEADKADRSLRFDRILCDVPCSGDGTLRKAPDLWRRWTDGLSMGIHRMQRSLLLRGLQMLVPGGRLVYSTCSMNPLEDEAVVASSLLELGPSWRLVDVSERLPGLQRRSGLASWRVRVEGVWYTAFEDVPEEAVNAHKLLPSMFTPPPERSAPLRLGRCMRVLPHLQNTGGFFIAVIQRAATPPNPLAPPPAAAPATVAAAAESPATVAPASRPGAVPATAAPAAPTDCTNPTSRAAGSAAAPAGVATSDDVTSDPSGDAGVPASTTTSSSAAQAAAPPQLHSHIDQQKGKPAAAHVLRVLHCGAKNRGSYDALYELTPSWHAELGAFYGLPATFPYEQLISRSVVGKTIFLIGSAVLRLLRADGGSKLHLVHTGTKLLERLDARPGLPFAFRLAQEGAAFLAPHMRRQRVFVPTTDLLELLRRRTMSVGGLGCETLRAALLAAAPGGLALVHDPEGTGTLRVDQPLPLVLAAIRSVGDAPVIELVVKNAECTSLYNRIANLPVVLLPLPAAEGATNEGTAAEGGGEVGAGDEGGATLMERRRERDDEED